MHCSKTAEYEKQREYINATKVNWQQTSQQKQWKHRDSGIQSVKRKNWVPCDLSRMKAKWKGLQVKKKDWNSKLQGS